MASEYTVETGESLSELVERVNKLIVCGYKPVGGILFTSEPDEAKFNSTADFIPYRSTYHQAMFLDQAE